jgi:predicted Zn-dependent peptidase
MKKLLIYTFGFLFLVQIAQAQVDRTKAPVASKAPKIQLGKPQMFELPNGLKGIVVQNNKIPRVSFSLNLDLDPIAEKDKAGYIDMAGQLLKRGTKTRTKAQIDEEIDFIGANLATFSTGAFAGSLKKHSDKTISILADVILNPSFPEAELEKMKKEAISALKTGKDDAGTISNNLQQVLRNGKNHPYGEIETEKTIGNITIEDCKKYYETYFRPNVAYLVIVGDINLKEAKALAIKYLGNWQRGEVPKNSFAAPQLPNATQVALSEKAGAVQTDLAITYPINLKLGDPDYIKAVLMNQILGGGGGARLYNNIREDKGYTYGAYSDLSQSRVVGSFTASASVRTEVTDSATVQFLYEMERIRNEKVKPEELQRYKSVMIGNFSRSVESPQTVANFALNIALYNLPIDYYETYLEKINAVTLEDIQAMAQKYIQPKNAYIVAVGDLKAIGEKMEKFGKTTRYDMYGKVDSGVDQSLLQGMTAEKVIDKYITAIGGKTNLEKIKSLKMLAEIEFQGQKIDVTILKKSPNQMANIQKLPAAFGGMEMKTIFDGKRGVNNGMQGKQEITGDDLTEMDYSARMFIETEYAQLGIKTELGEVKNIEEKPAVEVIYTAPNGRKLIRSYDVSSGLLVKSVQGPQVGFPRDYKEVQGVKFPFTLMVSSQMGELPLKFTNIEINPKIEDTVFKID